MKSNLREAMDAALRETVVPVLRSKGFQGSLPHFRRFVPGAIDLLTLQFDKWGGGFVVEIARSPDTGITHPWGKHVPPKKVTACDLPFEQRLRIQPGSGSSTDDWFRFDNGSVERTARDVLKHLDAMESWWQSQAKHEKEAF